MDKLPLYDEYHAIVEGSASRWFHDNRCAVTDTKPFILQAHDNWRANIILDEVYAAVEPVRPRHTMIHHGLSSQALAFNLFGPLLVRNDWDAVRPAFEAQGIPWPTPACIGRFEYDDGSVFGEEGRDQPTSWDAALGSSLDRPSILIEVKFTEHDLGQCSVFKRGDCNGRNPAADYNLCYLHTNKQRRYLLVAEALGVLGSEAFSGAFCPFTIYYQFFREVMFATVKNACMAYVLDDRNPALYFNTSDGPLGLIPFLLGTLPPNIATRVSVIPITSVIQAIEAFGRHRDWTGEFRKKYGFQDRAA